MKIATTVTQMIVRICALIQIVSGLLFWSGIGLEFVALHMLSGLLLVLALWTLAILAIVARVAVGIAALAVLWGVVVVAFGLTQSAILPVPNDLHWVIQVLHLLVGVAAVGLAENLGRRLKLRWLV